jgi:hypothetical protein
MSYTPTSIHAIAASLVFVFPTPWRSAHLATCEMEHATYVVGSDAALAFLGEILDNYLARERFTCCDICVGVSVVVDGQNWTGSYGDHLWHVMGWFYAMTRILRGGPQTTTTTFVWDESLLYLERQQDRLILFDQHVCARAEARGETPVEWAPIDVDLWEFASAMLQVGERYLALIDAFIQLLADRGHTLPTLLPLLEGLGDKPVAGRDDQLLKYAIIARELDIDRMPIDELRELLRQDGQL